MNFFYSKRGLFLTGGAAGLLMALLALKGNPPNMAICAACFIRDIAGALKFHSAGVVQYFRPEIAGIILGAFFISLYKKEFSTSSSSAVAVRFVLGFIMMVCTLVFLGCPLRMVLRMSAGDISSYVGLVGFVLGLGTGVMFLKKGYFISEGTTTGEGAANGYVLPVVVAVLMVLSVTTMAFAVSAKGPGSMHAPVYLSLAVGLLFGVIAQRTRMCFAGAFRNALFFKDLARISPVLGIFVIMLLFNLVNGSFKIAAFGPIAHEDTLWNILSMYGVGLAATLAGGCPLRHLVLAGSGSGNSVVVLLGMVTGAAASHNFSFAAAPSSINKLGQVVIGGPGIYGQIAVIVSLIVLFGIGIWGIKVAKSQ